MSINNVGGDGGQVKRVVRRAAASAGAVAVRRPPAPTRIHTCPSWEFVPLCLSFAKLWLFCPRYGWENEVYQRLSNDYGPSCCSRLSPKKTRVFTQANNWYAWWSISHSIFFFFSFSLFTSDQISIYQSYLYPASGMTVYQICLILITFAVLNYVIEARWLEHGVSCWICQLLLKYHGINMTFSNGAC